MVRAELGAGNRDAAVDLLERLKTRLVLIFSFLKVSSDHPIVRGYPEAVYNRISGVLTDHSAVMV